MAVIRNLSYCADQVRRFDRDRYLSALFVPAARREAVFALYAFNLEVAKTREMVSETMLGQIRLQWWRDALEGIYKGETRAHPVVEALTVAVAAADLSLELFRRLIDAREQDLDDAPPADLETLERYAEATSGSLLQLVQQVLGHSQGPSHEAARRVGVAWSLTGLLRAVAFHARAKRQYLPRDMLDELGVRSEELFALRPSVELSGVARRLAEVAAEHLSAARALRRDVPRPALRGLLLATLADGYLRSIRRAGYNVFAIPAASPARPLVLAWAAARGRY